MNIDDIKADSIETPPDQEILATIFDHQRELMEKYRPIEEGNGERFPDGWWLDNRLTQGRIKHLFWCTTEEIGEALEKMQEYRGWRERWDSDPDIRHFFEELADALHFFVEATIVSGTPDLPATLNTIWAEAMQIVSMSTNFPTSPEVRAHLGEFIFQLGLVANFLKLKTWKKTDVATDQPRYHNSLRTAWRLLFLVFALLQVTRKDLYILYVRKNLVNQFRQGSEY